MVICGVPYADAMTMNVRDANIFIEEYVKIKKGEANEPVYISKKAQELQAKRG